MTWHDVAQGSLQWEELRRGKFTASFFADLFCAKNTATYQTAINRVVFERVTGKTAETYSNDIMRRGVDLEPIAREEYELKTFNKVHNGGFFEFDEWIGCSPDGLIGKDGLVEIKCPQWNTIIDYTVSRNVPMKYMYQMQGQLAITGRLWCDFFAWHPDLPPVLLRVERDEKIIEAIFQKLSEAIEEAKIRLEKMK